MLSTMTLWNWERDRALFLLWKKHQKQSNLWPAEKKKTTSLMRDSTAPIRFEARICSSSKCDAFVCTWGAKNCIFRFCETRFCEASKFWAVFPSQFSYIGWLLLLESMGLIWTKIYIVYLISESVLQMDWKKLNVSPKISSFLTRKFNPDPLVSLEHFFLVEKKEKVHLSISWICPG